MTTVELELIEDSMADQVEHDAVLERLSPERQGQARTEFTGLECRHRDAAEAAEDRPDRAGRSRGCRRSSR